MKGSVKQIRSARNRYSLIRKAGLDKLRLSIFKSCKHIHAQIIDLTGNVLYEVSSSSKKCLVKTKMEKAIWAGKEIANLVKGQSLKFFYDRGHYAYHGIVKAFADSARESGMEF